MMRTRLSIWSASVLTGLLSLSLYADEPKMPGSLRLLDIPVGVAYLGASDGDADERPVRRQRIKAFRLGRTEVRNAEFAAFVSASGYVTSAERAGWGNNAYCLRTSYRHVNAPDASLDMVGFRCAGAAL